MGWVNPYNSNIPAIIAAMRLGGMRSVSPVDSSDIALRNDTHKTPRRGRVWRALWAIVRQRCPRCQKGKMFRGTFAMNDPCPVCDLLFQREEGYFLGAMYLSYALGVAILLPAYFLADWLLPHWNGYLITLLLWLCYLPLTPAVFRYSRVLWVHLERWGCPTDVSASSYEAYRRKQLAEQKAKSDAS